VSSQHLNRIGELAHALDIDIERPTEPRERLQWLERHRGWLHAIQELTLTEIEMNYREQLVTRDELRAEREEPQPD
jgi:hypothetical protein